MFTAYQILRSERNNLRVFLKCNFKVQNSKTKLHFKMFMERKSAKDLTNFESYAKLLLEEWARTWVYRFEKIKMWSSQNTAFDHIFDHLQTRTTWKQCSQEHGLAPFLDTKAHKITRNYTKNLCRTLRDTAFTRPNIFP